MACKRIAQILLMAAVGCGGGQTKQDPPLDDAKKIEIARNNLKSEDQAERLIAVATLGQMGAAAKQCIPDLKALEKDKEPTIRDAVKDAIQKIEKGG